MPSTCTSRLTSVPIVQFMRPVLQADIMASAQDIQSMLRFLTQDAKVPLAQALGKVKDMQAAKLNT
jgi:hypothetical protein